MTENQYFDERLKACSAEASGDAGGCRLSHELLFARNESEALERFCDGEASAAQTARFCALIKAE